MLDYYNNIYITFFSELSTRYQECYNYRFLLNNKFHVVIKTNVKY